MEESRDEYSTIKGALLLIVDDLNTNSLQFYFNVNKIYYSGTPISQTSKETARNMRAEFPSIGRKSARSIKGKRKLVREGEEFEKSEVKMQCLTRV